MRKDPDANDDAVARSHPKIDSEEPAQSEGGRRVIVIIGTGRSGTSLCAKILRELGVRLDTTLHRPNEMNPDGYFEDQEIVDISRDLMKKLGGSAQLPPRNDIPANTVEAEMTRLRTYIAKRSAESPEIWGFKDPRVSTLLPYFRRAFKNVGIVPTYIFCARDAGAIVRSLMDENAAQVERAEMIYYVRSFLALRDCSANAYVLHYERLIENPMIEVEKLWKYVSRGDTPIPLPASRIEALVDRRLDRSSLRAEPLRNALAKRVSELVSGMDGINFDRDHVLSELHEIDAIHNSYEVWITAARNQLSEARRLSQANASTSPLQDQQELIKQRTATLIADMSQLQSEVKSLKSERDAAATKAQARLNEVHELKSQLRRTIDLRETHAELTAALAKKHDKEKYLRSEKERLTNRLDDALAGNKMLSKRIDAITSSARYLTGSMLADAVRRPGWNTLALPWRLLRIRQTPKRRAKARK